MTIVSQPFATVNIESANAAGDPVTGTTRIITPPQPDTPGITKLLLNFDGALGSQPANDDTGFRTLTYVTNNPGSVDEPTIQAGGAFGNGMGGSAFDNGNNGSSQLQTEFTEDLDISNKDWCAEGWFSLAGSPAISANNTLLDLRIDVDNRLTVSVNRGSVGEFNLSLSYEFNNAGAGSMIGATMTVVPAQQFAWAVTVIGDDITLYLDGAVYLTVDKTGLNWGPGAYQATFTFRPSWAPIVDSLRIVTDCGVIAGPYLPSGPLTEITTCPI